MPKTQKMGVVVATAMSITIVVGAGLLALPGLSYALAGRYGHWPWILVGALMLPLLTIFAHFASEHPSAGGVVGYVRVSLGHRLGGVAEMIVLGTFTLGIPAIALIGAAYLEQVLPGLSLMQASLAVVTLAFAAGLLGIRVSGAVQTVLAALIVVGLTGIGIAYLLTQGWPVQASPLPNTMADWRAILLAVPVILFAYTGWEMTAFLAEDMREPERTMPTSIWASFVVVLLMYVFLAWLIASVATPAPDWSSAPFVELSRTVFGSAGGQVVAVLAALLVVANVIAAFLSASRAFYAAGRDGLLPRQLGQRHAHDQPVRGMTLAWLVFMAVIVGSQTTGLGVDTLLQLAGQNFFVLYLLAACGYARLYAKALWQKLLAGLAVLAVLAMFSLFSLPGLLYCLLLAIVGWMTSPPTPASSASH